MKRVAANILFVVVGAAGIGMGIVVCVLLQMMLERLWSLYTDQYFFATNRTILAVAALAGCWFIGRGIVQSWRGR